MAEELIIAGKTKAERYENLLPQIEAVVQGETDMIANMANVASMLWETSSNSLRRVSSMTLGRDASI